MAFDNLHHVVRDRAAEITPKRAPVNAIDHGPIGDLNAAYRQAKADPGMRAVVLTSAFTRAFPAGMDLAMIRGKRGLDRRRYLQKLHFEMHDPQYRRGKPTIAALTGPARAAGVTLAVSCDCIVAARDAFMRASDFEDRRAIGNTVETICNIVETDDAREGLAAFNEKRSPRW